MIRILQGDCREVLRTLPDASVHCCVTSPPYFGLRDYGTAQWDGGDPACDHKGAALASSSSTLDGYTSENVKIRQQGGVPFRDTCGKCGARRIDAQIGLEASPDAYIAEMVSVFREVRRVLRDDGTLWLNLGDSYNSGTQFNHGAPGSKAAYGEWSGEWPGHRPKVPGYKPKDLLMMPARVALALQAEGWWLRSDIIWAKPNPMPESVTDRPTSAHEHVFLLTKSAKYFFDADAVREPQDERTQRAAEKYRNDPDIAAARSRGNIGAAPDRSDSGKTLHIDNNAFSNPNGRNIRNVWTIATALFPDAHFATFPPELAERCIKAGTSERGCCANCGAPWVRQVERGAVQSTGGSKTGARANNLATVSVNGQTADNAYNTGEFVQREHITTGWLPSCQCNAAVVPATVLDPFAGAFTAPMVADRLQRNAIGIELSPSYCRMARARLLQDAGMFAEVAAE